MAKTVADLLIDRLTQWGVNVLFGLPGDGINGIFEALRTHKDKVRFIQVRHEEAAAFAACGYAKYAGGLGVCMATSGPGGIHLLNGLYDAKCDNQPVLAITGHTFHDLIGTHYQQDVDLTKLYMDVAAYNERVMGPAHVKNVLDEAIRTALSRRRPAHICIPKDDTADQKTVAGESSIHIDPHQIVKGKDADGTCSYSAVGVAGHARDVGAGVAKRKAEAAQREVQKALQEAEEKIRKGWKDLW